MELEFVCTIQPTYLNALAAGAASIALVLIGAMAVGIRRRIIEPGVTIPRGVVAALHRALLIVVAVHVAAVVLNRFLVDERFVRDYEARQRRSAPIVRAALNRETMHRLVFGGVLAGLAGLSVLIWRRSPTE